jgi:type I restriction enzyme S subunit
VLNIDRDEVFLQATETYRAAGVYSFGKGLFERGLILGADTAYTSLYRLRENQLILSRLNGWEGAVDVVTAQYAGCFVSSEYPTFAINSDLVHPGYLRWFARWPGFWEQLAPRGSMVRRKRVNPAQLLEVKLPLFPLVAQRRLASRLDKIWAYTTDVARLSTQASHIAAALGTAKSSRPDLSDAAKNELGWREVSLSSVMQLATDRIRVEIGSSYPNLGIYSFGRGLFMKPNIDGAVTSARFLNRVQSGQFIYSRLFAFEGAYGFVPPKFNGYYVSTEFPAFDTDPKYLDARWLASFLRSPDRWVELASSSKGLGVRRQRVPVESILAYKLWLPPVEHQRAIVHTINLLDGIMVARARSDRLVRSLMSAALNEVFAKAA